jgi:hypothetical protein
MTAQQDDLTTARRRLLKAGADRDLWRAAGDREKYMEAYCLCEALELQLGALSKQASQERLRPTHSEAAHAQPRRISVQVG